MDEERDRIGIKCPNCDHSVVTLPEHYRLGGELICPGCGMTLESASADGESLLEKAEHAFSAIIKGRKGG